MAMPKTYDVVTHRDMQIDDVDSGLPRLTVDLSAAGGVSFSVRLSPDACAALVDGLAGVAPPPHGEVRIIARCDATTLAKAMTLLSSPKEPS